MRLAVVLVVLLCGLARADDKALARYAGLLVISPDPPPTVADDLPKYLAANASKDHAYELIKGPPWELNVIELLAKDPKDAPVTLEIADSADAKAAPLLAIELTAKRKLVMAHATATVAAGFAAHKVYAVRLRRGKTVLGQATLTLRD